MIGLHVGLQPRSNQRLLKLHHSHSCARSDAVYLKDPTYARFDAKTQGKASKTASVFNYMYKACWSRAEALFDTQFLLLCRLDNPLIPALSVHSESSEVTEEMICECERLGIVRSVNAVVTRWSPNNKRDKKYKV